jgi:hypothetical protein
MSRILCLFLFLAAFFGAGVGVGAGEAGEFWSRVYREMPTLRQKQSVMQNIVFLDDRSLESFLSSSLDELISGGFARYRTDRNSYADWEALTISVISELGDIKARSAGSAIRDVMRTAASSRLKSEAMTALGLIRAAQYAPEIAGMLTDLNRNSRSDRENAEVEAYGAVLALGNLKDPSGIEPLFYAAVGWYGDRVASAAEQSLLSLTDDPAVPLAAIIKNAGDYGHKREALAMGMRSAAPEESKTNLAVEALREGLNFGDSDYIRKRGLANLRVDAAAALITLETSAGESAALLNRAVDAGDLDEKLIAVLALGSDGGNEAAGYLAERLSRYNQRQISGPALSRDELSLVRQLVYALGESANSRGLEALRGMKSAGYSTILLRLADGAIAKINVD